MITGTVLKRRGWPDGRITRLAKAAAAALAAAGADDDAILDRLDRVRAAPDEYLDDATLGELARECLRRAASASPLPAGEGPGVRATPVPYRAWGEDLIEPGARHQMEQALRLPVAVAGALLPDAHMGYGLPIGGVLATAGAVIPYAVGVDIACRMRLSVYPAGPDELRRGAQRFEQALLRQTRFGLGAGWEGAHPPEHAVLDDPDWSATPLLRALRDKARRQLGTSGTGNHFVEWGVLHLPGDLPELGLPAGDHLALLSHSGSRAVGFKIAEAYSALARRLHPALDKSLQHLAWLPLEGESGQEYWHAMQLAGRFAAANHAVIHRRVAAAAGLEERAHAENHHNFAWLETLPDGTQAVVHRKGATPAGAGVLGIIPGSMGDAGYLVRGRGAPGALDSASHGAGRRMSRQAALSSLTRKARDDYLRARGVTLLGGGLDESPQVYKDVRDVLAAQDDLVEVVGRFTPRIVRMADEAGDY